MKFDFFLSNIFFQFSSNFSPFLPIFLQVVKISLGISKGSLFHLSFFLTNDTSSSPKGEPCEDAFPDLLGEPKPIKVLQEIILGLLDFEALDIELDICFSL